MSTTKYLGNIGTCIAILLSFIYILVLTLIPPMPTFPSQYIALPVLSPFTLNVPLIFENNAAIWASVSFPVFKFSPMFIFISKSTVSVHLSIAAVFSVEFISVLTGSLEQPIKAITEIIISEIIKAIFFLIPSSPSFCIYITFINLYYPILLIHFKYIPL